MTSPNYVLSMELGELEELPDRDEAVTLIVSTSIVSLLFEIDTLVGQLADDLTEKFLAGMTNLRAREELANAMAWSELHYAVQWDHPFPENNLDWSIFTSDYVVHAFAQNNLVEINLEVRVD